MGFMSAKINTLFLFQLSNQYAYLPRRFVELYVTRCTTCCTRKSFPTPVSGKPIVTKGFLHRVQIDLVSFESIPDGKYRYIAHLRDHFTRFSWTCALSSKEASEVAAFLFSVFTVFGPPLILQSDNGREFTAQVIYELIGLWKEIHIINGRPRHPQSQGSVENSNKTLKQSISKWMEDHSRSDWSIGLPTITCKRYAKCFCLFSLHNAVFFLDAMNIRRSEPTGHTPYALVFGQQPLRYFGMLEEWRLHNVVMEEDLPENMSMDEESVADDCHDKDGTSDDQRTFCTAVPSGASTDIHKPLELRDGIKTQYVGNFEQDCISISVSYSCVQVKLAY
jgi:transposase InsO family protein